MQWTAEQEVAAVEQQLPSEKIAMRKAGASLAQCVEFLRAERDAYQQQLAAGEAREAALQRENEILTRANKDLLGDWVYEQDRRITAEAERDQATRDQGGDVRVLRAERDRAIDAWDRATERELAAEAAIVSLQAERDEMVRVAGEVLGTDPENRSPGCVAALAGWTGQLLTDLQESRQKAAREFAWAEQSMAESRQQHLVIERLNEQLLDLQAQLQAITQEMRVRLANHADGDIAIHVSIVRGWLEALTK